MRRRAWGSIVERGGKFYAQIRVDGQRTMRLLRLDDRDGTPVTDELDAEPAMERLRRQLAAADDLAEGRSVSLGTWLDEEYADILRSRLVPHAAAQAEAYLTRYWGWAVARLGEDATMAQVGRGDAELFVADFLAGRVPANPRGRRGARASYRPSYARRVVNVLRRAWADALARHLVTENVWSKMRLPRIQEQTVPWVAPQDLGRLLEAAPDRYRPLLRLLAGTGLRVSEALALRWESIDLVAGVVHVRSGKTRGARRSVPLPTGLRQELEAARGRAAADDLVLEPVSGYHALLALQATCAHLNLPRLTLHQLRHTYASHLVVAGTPPTVVAALLGHVDGGALVLRLYGRWYPQDAQARAVQALELFRATGGTAPASRGTRDRSSGRAARSGGGTSRAGRSRR